MRVKGVILCILFLLLCSFLISSSNITMPDPQTAKMESIPSQESETDIIISSGPKDIKEKTGILFFLGWVWLSIFVLIYFLRQKIKETDRLYQSGYYSDGKDKICLEE